VVTVTPTAKEKLKEILQERTMDPQEAMRIIRFPLNPEQLEFVLDKEKEADHVVESEEGRKLLLIGPLLVLVLGEKVIDYQETPQRVGFTISKPTPSA